jgi:hypothetical protein
MEMTVATFKRKGARTSVIHEAVRRLGADMEPPTWARGLPAWNNLPEGWWLVRFPEGYVAQFADDAFHDMFAEFVSPPNT